MDATARAALTTDLTVDITTHGRRTGQPRRLEIWLLCVHDRFFITGTPGPRGWLANLRADPTITVHLKQQVHADLPARAEVVQDDATRRAVLAGAAASWYRGQAPLETLVARSPMVELFFDDVATTSGGADGVIEPIVGLPAGVVGMRAVGPFTIADYKDVIQPELDRRSDRLQDVRLLLYLGPDFSGFGEGAWAELTSELRRTPFDRGALVTDDTQIRHGMRVLRWALRGKVRTFRNREYDDAVTWVAG